MLAVATVKQRKQSQSFLFLPVPTQEVCASQRLNVELCADYFIFKPDIEFSTTEDDKPTEINILIVVTNFC